MSRQSTTTTRVCEHCGTEFRVYLSDLKRRPARYCSPICRTDAAVITLAESFRRHVGSPLENGCIPWIGARDEAGYGRIGNRRGGPQTAHRASWELVNGPVTDGLFVLHRCDNPACVNVAHLFLGTQADNMADMRAKNRGAKGEGHGHAKLTADKVQEIRERHKAGGVTCRSLGAEYGVSSAVIGHVLKGDAWTHVLPRNTTV